MKLFDKIFKKSKNTYKISQKQEETLVYMLKPKRRVKLKSKVVVPENFCAVILSREKLLDTIPTGEHELNGFTMEKACKINKLDKPTKKGYKKELKLDFYFVNLNVCKISNDFNIKKLNMNVSYVLEFKIINPHKFLKFLINERIIFDEKFASSYLTFSLSRLLYYYFLDNKLIEENKTKDFIIKKLNHIGLEVYNLEISSDETNNTIKNNSLKKNFENSELIMDKNPEKVQNLDKELQNTEINWKIQQSQNRVVESSLVNLDDISSESISYFICDECGAKLPKNSKVCYNCKKSFVEKNTCENCGKEIKNGTYVCPYCNCVLIK